MKSVSIHLDDERSNKLTAISEATAGREATVNVAGIQITTQQRKISSSQLAINLLNEAIDSAYARL